MKQYLLSIQQPEGDPEPALLERVMQDLAVLNADMKDAGAYVFSNGLEAPSTATVLRLTDDEVLMTDGPFAEAPEQVGASAAPRRRRTPTTGRSRAPTTPPSGLSCGDAATRSPRVKRPAERLWEVARRG